MDAGRARHPVHVRPGVRVDRRYDLHSDADPVSAPRLAGSCAPSPAAFRTALLLGQSPGKEMAELAARNRLFPHDGHADCRPADAQCGLLSLVYPTGWLVALYPIA